MEDKISRRSFIKGASIGLLALPLLAAGCENGIVVGDPTTYNNYIKPVNTIAGDTTLTNVYAGVICDSPTNINVTLPQAINSGLVYHIKCIGLGSVVVLAVGSDTIDGETTQTVRQWECMDILDAASGKWVII